MLKASRRRHGWVAGKMGWRNNRPKRWKLPRCHTVPKSKFTTSRHQRLFKKKLWERLGSRCSERYGWLLGPVLFFISLRFGKPRRRTSTCHLSPRFLILAIKTPHHCDRGATGRDYPANLFAKNLRKPNGARGLSSMPTHSANSWLNPSISIA